MHGFRAIKTPLVELHEFFFLLSIDERLTRGGCPGAVTRAGFNCLNRCARERLIDSLKGATTAQKSNVYDGKASRGSCLVQQNYNTLKFSFANISVAPVEYRAAKNTKIDEEPVATEHKHRAAHLIDDRSEQRRAGELYPPQALPDRMCIDHRSTDRPI